MNLSARIQTLNCPFARCFAALLFLGATLLATVTFLPPAKAGTEALAFPPSPPLSVGDDAPAFQLRAYNEDIALKIAKGPQVSLGNFVGIAPENPHKVVLLGFFALWNEKSVAELQTFQKLQKQFKDNQVAIIMISIDNQDTRPVYDALENARVSYPVLRDRFSVVYNRYGVTKLPSLFLIDNEGKIAAIGDGYREDVESYLVQEIKRLLNE